MGYLPLTRMDDSIHMQPLYCTPKASGVIMSPECIMVTSPDIVKWVQTGHRDKDNSGHLVCMDKDDQVVLKLNLHKMDGLYYSWMYSYATDYNLIRVHTVHGPQSTPLPHRSGSPHISLKTQTMMMMMMMMMMIGPCNWTTSPLTQTAPARLR